MARPRIVVTLSNPERAADPAAAEAKNRRYLAVVERHGANPVPLDERVPAQARDAALADMHALLIAGGADLDPALYGETPDGSNPPEPGRDALDAAAFEAAIASGVPILGVCRGLQAINVFSGGRLVQHVDDHESPPYPARAAAATRHRLRLEPGTRLAGILGGAGTLEVNSFHHQAVAADGLADGLRVAGLAPHDGGDLVEALEAADPDRWLVAVQCHPERVESTPAEMDALWTAFVAAAGDRRNDRRLNGP
ncbi:MAG TPA: gamma-glutamyl-gamma-aminobutyrate hydrolase family protein [Candidatus Limnocylindria bacterium]|nr:gamma-glutamyl-gamma-aminobutyrate hydrolase family protein [Candidatus Limnocylindria bacterium]